MDVFLVTRSYEQGARIRWLCVKLFGLEASPRIIYFTGTGKTFVRLIATFISSTELNFVATLLEHSISSLSCTPMTLS
jgi:hypothetical protein